MRNQDDLFLALMGLTLVTLRGAVVGEPFVVVPLVSTTSSDGPALFNMVIFLVEPPNCFEAFWAE